MPLVIDSEDVRAAADRIAGRVRRTPISRLEVPAATTAGQSVDQTAGWTTDRTAGRFSVAEVLLVHEYLQHTGGFKARGAINLAEWHRLAGSMPSAGVAIASGGNAGLACAWAARAAGSPATVFVPVTAPAVKLAQLRGYGGEIRLAGADYAEAVQACSEYAQQSGALLSHAYDNPLIAAGAGTCAADALSQAAGAIDTVLVAVGGGGLLAGTIAAIAPAGCRVVAVEPANCCALAAALQAGGPVDAATDSVAADSLGARRVSQMAYAMAAVAEVRAVQVSDQAIIAARRYLWQHSRIVVEYGGATAFAGLLSGAYQPAPDERVAVILCGANTDPGDLVAAER